MVSCQGLRRCGERLGADNERKRASRQDGGAHVGVAGVCRKDHVLVGQTTAHARSSAKLHSPRSGLKGCNDRRSGCGGDDHLDVNGCQCRPRTLRIRVFAAEIDKSRSAGGGRRRMRTHAPVDEEGHHHVRERRAGIGDLPREHDTVGPLAAAIAHGAEVNAVTRGVVDQAREIRSVRRPRDQSRRGQRIDPEPTRRGRCARRAAPRGPRTRRRRRASRTRDDPPDRPH